MSSWFQNPGTKPVLWFGTASLTFLVLALSLSYRYAARMDREFDDRLFLFAAGVFGFDALIQLAGAWLRPTPYTARIGRIYFIGTTIVFAIFIIGGRITFGRLAWYLFLVLIPTSPILLGLQVAFPFMLLCTKGRNPQQPSAS